MQHGNMARSVWDYGLLAAECSKLKPTSWGKRPLVHNYTYWKELHALLQKCMAWNALLLLVVCYAIVTCTWAAQRK